MERKALVTVSDKNISRRFAVMDIGSNTIRLLVAEQSPRGFRELHSSQVITRLGQKAHENGILLPQAMERTLDGIATLLDGAASLKPFSVCAAATHAVRKSSNKEEFEARFRQRLGFGLLVIPQETEAGLSLEGAAMVVGNDAPVVLFDIGGGSTEFICRGADGAIHDVGTELGVVRLAETFIHRVPLAKEEFGRLMDYLHSELNEMARKLDPVRPFTLVGTAGTVTSIAAMVYNVNPYDPARVNNRVLLRKVVAELADDVGRLSIEERGRIPAIQNGREDLIIPGIGIALAAMDALAVDRLTVSDAGLREGLMLAAIAGRVPLWDI